MISNDKRKAFETLSSKICDTSDNISGQKVLFYIYLFQVTLNNLDSQTKLNIFTSTDRKIWQEKEKK